MEITRNEHAPRNTEHGQSVDEEGAKSYGDQAATDSFSLHGPLFRTVCSNQSRLMDHGSLSNIALPLDDCLPPAKDAAGSGYQCGRMLCKVK